MSKTRKHLFFRQRAERSRRDRRSEIPPCQDLREAQSRQTDRQAREARTNHVSRQGFFETPPQQETEKKLQAYTHDAAHRQVARNPEIASLC